MQQFGLFKQCQNGLLELLQSPREELILDSRYFGAVSTPRLKELSQKIEVVRLPLFKGDFEPYRCDTLYQLMELIAMQSRRTLAQIS